MRRLPVEEVAGLALAALANARRLYDDAAMLQEAGRFPSAFILLGLAADELGKHMMVAALPSRSDTDDEWRKFWRRMNRHEEKLGNTLLSTWLFDPSDDGEPPDPRAFHEQRLAATYADIRCGALESPVDVIDAARLRQWFLAIGQHLAFCERILLGTDIETLAEILSRVRANAAKVDDRQEEGAIGRLAHAVAVAYGGSEDTARRLASLIAGQYQN